MMDIRAIDLQPMLQPPNINSGIDYRKRLIYDSLDDAESVVEHAVRVHHLDNLFEHLPCADVLPTYDEQLAKRVGEELEEMAEQFSTELQDLVQDSKTLCGFSLISGLAAVSFNVAEDAVMLTQMYSIIQVLMCKNPSKNLLPFVDLALQMLVLRLRKHLCHLVHPTVVLAVVTEKNPPSFKSYVVNRMPLESIPPPSYLMVKKLDKEGACFDFSALNCLHYVSIFDSHTWPHQEVSLEKSKFAALQMALTEGVSYPAVVEGEIGTGKTMCLHIAQILLQNKANWDPLLQSPTLIVCYTNHALDQFLEETLNFTQDGNTVNVNVSQLGGSSLTLSILYCYLACVNSLLIVLVKFIHFILLNMLPILFWLQVQFLKIWQSVDHARCVINTCARFTRHDECWGFTSAGEWLRTNKTNRMNNLTAPEGVCSVLL